MDRQPDRGSGHRRGPDQHGQGGQEHQRVLVPAPPVRAPGQLADARQVEALGDDREHEERDEEGDEARDRRAAEPDDRPAQRRDAAADLDGDEGLPVAAPQHDVVDAQDEAAGDHDGPAGAHRQRPHEGEQRAEGHAHGCAVGPPALDRDRALEGDQGPDEADHHEHAVPAREAIAAQWGGQAQQGERGVHPHEHGQPARDEEEDAAQPTAGGPPRRGRRGGRGCGLRRCGLRHGALSWDR